MDAPLLATKLHIPPPAHRTLRRNHLIEVLDHGVREYKLTLVSAAAGYGKTTLLAQWARDSAFPVVWLSLEQEDNDVDRFFRYLLGAWAVLRPEIHESPLGLLLSGTYPDRNALLTAFLTAANDTCNPVVFVLDDYHLIAEPAIHEALTFLLDHLPPDLHVVVAGRAEPPLPLARYRARHELLELTGEDLQFREDETSRFLNDAMGLLLSDSAIAAVHAQLEGWIAGLQLVALAMRRFPDATTDLAISGRHRFISDYLSEDVVTRQPPEIQAFLLQTSVLDRLCGVLCDAVTEQAGSQEILERLEREHLFLTPLDDRREWFRYHGLFADFLRAELQRRRPEQLTEMHRRAARWYLSHDLPDEAFHHAVDGADSELVAEILEHYTSVKLQGGELRVLQGWLDALPAPWFDTEPLLGLARAGVHMFNGALDASVRCIDDVERRLSQMAAADTRQHQAKVTAFRCFVACFANDLKEAEAHAAEALRDLPEEGDYRGDVYHALGETYGRNGLWEQAREYLLKALHSSRAPVTALRAAHVYGALADLDLRQGRLRDADVHWLQALAAVEAPANWGRLPLPVIGWVYLRRGELLYERNDLTDAWDYINRGLDRAVLGGDARTLIAGYVIACRWHLTAGDMEAAADYLDRARPLVAQSSFPDWSGRFQRCQLEVWMAQDRLRDATSWASATLCDDSEQRRPDGETTDLALIRVLVAKGDRPSGEQALALLERLLPAAEAEGRLGIAIEALALRALALWHRGERTEALTALQRALGFAEPEGYVRLFADLGPPMIRLLQEARSRRLMPDYVATLLAACGAGLATSDSSLGTLAEPLSRREQEVLQLIAAGLTNREAAETLFISPETVKKHAAAIYGKLGARHRAQAVARARELGLLD